MQNRLGGPSTMWPDDDELMEAAGRTPQYGGDSINQRAGQLIGESLAQEAMAGNVKAAPWPSWEGNTQG